MEYPALLKKLRIDPTNKNRIINAPDSYTKFFKELVFNTGKKNSRYDAVILFVQSQNQLKKHLTTCMDSMEDDSLLWLAYPRKSSEISSDLTRDRGWEPITSKGYRSVAAVSIDDTWAALRFKKEEEAPGRSKVSDEAVSRQTGKTWQEWFVKLNAAGGKSKSHQEIVGILTGKYGLNAWWSQMVTNTYEQYIKRRKKHQKTSGFEVSVSKTINAPARELYNLWNDPLKRAKWLTDPAITITTSNPNRSIRAKWIDNKTRISVEFFTKSESKTQVTVQHLKLASLKEAEKTKACWRNELGTLKDMAEAIKSPD